MTEMRTMTLTANQLWRQVGWLGHSGAFYPMATLEPITAERGGYAPVWQLLENEQPITDDLSEPSS